MKWRDVFAVLVALVAYVVAERLASRLTPTPALTISPDHYFWLLSSIAAAVFFLASLAGSLIAHGRFLTLGLLLWAIFTAAAMISGYRLERPAAPVTFLAFALRNLPMLSATLAGTLAGVTLGKMLTTHKRVAESTQAAT